MLQDLQTVENDLKNVAAFEQLFTVYQELIEGASSGLSQLQVDQIDSNLQQARQQLLADRTQYRNDLEQYKMQLGLPPDVPLTLDRRFTASFSRSSTRSTGGRSIRSGTWPTSPGSSPGCPSSRTWSSTAARSSGSTGTTN